MRKPLIAGNWKMHKNIVESVSFLKSLKEQALPSAVEAVICAPFLSLPALAQLAEGTAIGIGAQHVHEAEEGAYTGEISVPMLKAAGVSYIIIGHSERRAHFSETDEGVNRKVQAVLAANLTPIICVGEQLSEREAGKTGEVVRNQVSAALHGVSASDAAKVVIAYEPVWAIGSGQAATAEDAEEVCALIRDLLTAQYDELVSESVRIQYGGSVKPENIATFIAQPNIDGALVGGASLEVDSYVQLLRGAQDS